MRANEAITCDYRNIGSRQHVLMISIAHEVNFTQANASGKCSKQHCARVAIASIRCEAPQWHRKPEAMLAVAWIRCISILQLLDETNKRTELFAQARGAPSASFRQDRTGKRSHILNTCSNHPFIVRREHIAFLSTSPMHAMECQHAVKRGTLTYKLSIVNVADDSVVNLVTKCALHGERTRYINGTTNGERTPHSARLHDARVAIPTDNRNCIDVFPCPAPLFDGLRQ
jgi:hypothetical protein